MTIESPEATLRRAEFERRFNEAAADVRERMIEEYAAQERRLRTIPEVADDIVREHFADMAGDWRDFPA